MIRAERKTEVVFSSTVNHCYRKAVKRSLPSSSFSISRKGLGGGEGTSSISSLPIRRRDSSREVERRILLCGTRRNRNRKCPLHLSSLAGAATAGSSCFERALERGTNGRRSSLGSTLPGKRVVRYRASVPVEFSRPSRYVPPSRDHACRNAGVFCDL